MLVTVGIKVQNKYRKLLILMIMIINVTAIIKILNRSQKPWLISLIKFSVLGINNWHN